MVGSSDRGFVESVTLTARTLLKQASTLFWLAPVRHAVVHHADKLGGALAECPNLARLTSLRVGGLYAADAVRLIALPRGWRCSTSAATTSARRGR